jgi:hypothetical protein
MVVENLNITHFLVSRSDVGMRDALGFTSIDPKIAFHPRQGISKATQSDWRKDQGSTRRKNTGSFGRRRKMKVADGVELCKSPKKRFSASIRVVFQQPSLRGSACSS